MSGPTAADVLLTFLPLLLLFAAAALIVRNLRKFQAEYLELSRRQTEAMERIADSLDKLTVGGPRSP